MLRYYFAVRQWLLFHMRAKGVGWKRIAADLWARVGTIYRVALNGSKIREKVF